MSVVAGNLSLRGDGVATHEGVEVHVPGLFAGEHADVRIEHVSRQRPRAVARLETIAEPHPARRAAPCPRHRSHEACTGCALMELEEAAQRDQKRVMLAALGLVVDEVEAAPASLGYRMSSKRVAFARGAAVALGSYVRESHRPAAMDGCLVDHPRIVAAFDELARVASELGLSAFDAETGEGELRYAWAKTDGEAVLLTVITARDERERITRLADALTVPSTVALSVQASEGNAIRGERAWTLRGPESMTVTLSGVSIEVGALGFLQPNPRTIESAYAALTDAPGGALAFDLYAGVGVTTALLRARYAEVIAVEHDPASAGAAARTVESFLAEARAKPPDLVVANPPRKGFSRAVTEALIALRAPRIHIMSCGPEGLARDLAALTAAGYRVTCMRAFDTLPQTPHVELVVHLSR